MKTIKLSKSGSQKLQSGHHYLKEQDCQDLSKSYAPGEWIICVDEKSRQKYLGFINLNVAPSRPVIMVVQKIGDSPGPEGEEFETGKAWVMELIARSIKRRSLWKKYENCCRLIYGDSDHLPGLVADLYENCVLIQINSAGIDRYRSQIKDFFSQSYPHLQVGILDNPQQRALQNLPNFEEELKIDTISLRENGFQLSIPLKKMQKVGYYYDHRNNRERLERFIHENSLKFSRGLDLFCYVGAWGLCQLRAGVDRVTFVDQGDFGEVVEQNIRNNHLPGEWEFFRRDAFGFVNEEIQKGAKYDVIASDPPAFTKSARGKEEALSGYARLHGKLIRLMNDRGLLVINSCTKYVSFEDLDKTVQEAARRENAEVRLLDLGLQGWDHPMRSLADHSFYLKYLSYYVEK